MRNIRDEAEEQGRGRRSLLISCSAARWPLCGPWGQRKRPEGHPYLGTVERSTLSRMDGADEQLMPMPEKSRNYGYSESQNRPYSRFHNAHSFTKRQDHCESAITGYSLDSQSCSPIIDWLNSSSYCYDDYVPRVTNRLTVLAGPSVTALRHVGCTVRAAGNLPCATEANLTAWLVWRRSWV
jgi:hypothetical protein